MTAYLCRAMLGALAVAAVCVGAALAQQTTSPPPPIRQFDIDTVSHLGEAMFEQDQAAAKATHTLLRATSKKDRAQLAGWIVTKTDGRNVVRFLRRKPDGGLEAMYELWPGDSKSPPTAPTTPELTSEEQARFDASQTALASVQRRCAEGLNSIVLPDPDGENWLVWVMEATTKSNQVVFGGHTRFTISHDGNTVLRRDALSRGCLTMPKDDDPLLVTGLVSPQPLETHVFISLSQRMAVYVATFAPDRVWAVEGTKITIVPTDKP